MRKASQVPPLKCDKRGRAVVYHASIQNSSKRLVLGKHGTREAEAKYRAFLAKLAGDASTTEVVVAKPSDGLSIFDLIIAWDAWAPSKYQRPEGMAREYESMKDSISLLAEVHGPDLASSIGSVKILALRNRIATCGRFARTTTNKHLSRIKRFFKWAALNELIPVTQQQQIELVPGVRKGELGTRETDPVVSAEVRSMIALEPFLAPVVADMVWTQFLCVMRPGEVCMMHEDGIDTTADVWIYRPASHKTAWRDEKLIKAIPQAARLLIEPRLGKPSGYLFDPNEATAWGREQAAKKRGPRKTKRYPCEEKRVYANRSSRKLRPHYQTGSYGNAIRRGIERAQEAKVEITPFSPNQIRHAVVNWLDGELGEHDAAQILAGHKSAETTNTYREPIVARLIKLAGKMDKAFTQLQSDS